MAMRQPVFPRSGVIVLGLNSVHSLVPSTVTAQVESFLSSHRIEDAVELADQRRKRVEGSLSVDEDEADELRYVYQRIGFQCFAETLFEDAGKNLFNGELDPRILVSYFPDLRGSFFSPTDQVDMFAGVAANMSKEDSVDDIIRNYSPHLSPNTRSAPPTAELRKILGMAAKEMLEVFLRKCKTRRQLNPRHTKKAKDPLNAVIDTVLAKLYAQLEKTKELYALLEGPNDVDLSEVEILLQSTGQYNALCMLYKRYGSDSKLLEAWGKLIDGDWTDEDIKDPLSDMITLLDEKRDDSLTKHWALWLLKRNPERGIKLLMSSNTGKRKDTSEEDISMLKQIEEANHAASETYLEYLIFQKRSISRQLQSRFALSCVDQLLKSLRNDAVSKLWRAKASSYASSTNDSSFLSYFTSTTPDSEHKRVRLKTILLLAGSSFYDPNVVKAQIQEYEKILKLELAILEGKLGNHRSALSILVHDLHDTTSAEIYCTYGGDIVPIKTAQSIADSCDLQSWANALFTTHVKGKGSKATPVPLTRQITTDESTRKDLLKILLEVYMSDELSGAQNASRLLNSQGVNLDLVDIITLVPPKWPLNTLSSFLVRSLRRTVHIQQEGAIVKNISLGQNIEVKDHSWTILREDGAIIEEAADDDDESSSQSYREKIGFSEKLDQVKATELPLLPQGVTEKERYETQPDGTAEDV